MPQIITAHEADQLIRLRRPLGCDQQGRYPEAAHPCTDLGDDDEDGPSLYGAFNALPAIAVFLVSLAAFVALVFAAVGRQ